MHVFYLAILNAGDGEYGTCSHVVESFGLCEIPRQGILRGCIERLGGWLQQILSAPSRAVQCAISSTA